MVGGSVKKKKKKKKKSDAHIEYNIGNHRYAHSLIDQLGFPEELIVNKSVEETLEALKKN